MNNNDVKVFLEIAKEDLIASEILFDNRMFAQSVFYFQQAVEKSIKYLGLKNGIIAKEDLLKNVGHKPIEIFKAVMKNPKLEMTKKQVAENIEILNQNKNFIESNHLDKSVPFVLNQIQEISNSDQAPFETNCLNPQEFYKQISALLPNNPYVKKLINSPHNSQADEIIWGMIQEFNHDLPKYIQSISILLFTSNLISKHVTKVRYPDVKQMENPSLFYTAENQLVSALPELNKRIHLCVSTIEKFEEI